MEEGSVMVDGMDSSNEETSTEVDVNNSVESEGSKEGASPSSDSNSQGSKGTEDGSDSDSEGDKSNEGSQEDKAGTKPPASKPEDKTDKGTKLDQDPLSRANQLRANAERDLRAAYDLLGDPQRLGQYLEDLRKDHGAKPEKGEATNTDLDTLDPEKIESVEDLKTFAKSLKEASKKEIDAVKKQINGMTEQQREESIATSVSQGIGEVQSKYSELRSHKSDGSPNPEYIPELDNLIGETFERLDKDARTGRFKGSISIMEVADRIMNARKIGEASGSRKAKTDVVDKSRGRVNAAGSSSGSVSTDDSKLSASATIAARIQKAAKARR